MKKSLIALFGLLSASYVSSEDIDLYIGDVTQRTGVRPQVLIILDNSGSMNTLEEVKAPYVNDPENPYPAIGSDNSLSGKFIYFTKGTGVDNQTMPVPDSPSESRRFLDNINSCATARERLEEFGFYTGRIREYVTKGNSGSWEEIPDNNGANIEVIDCEDDVNQLPEILDPEVNLGVDPSTGTQLDNGYPVNGKGNKQNPVYFGTLDESKSSVQWTGEVVTLYTDNYLRYYHSEDIQMVNESRLDIAKDTLTTVIATTPSIDFGLEVFNYNFPGENTRDGGRVVFKIQESTAAARAELQDLINFEVDGETNTPLCESLWEAAQYFGGKAVDFGDDDKNYGGSTYQANTPPRDTSIESGGKYISPYSGCSNELFIILITDGIPTEDNAADAKIQALPGYEGGPFQVGGKDNYLVALADWMHNSDDEIRAEKEIDINTNIPGVQHATLITVGFSEGADDAAPILTAAAEAGGGSYYRAADKSELTESIIAALSSISRINASFTAPSVATNNFDRTETLDAVYYAMFLPDRGPRWSGNLKKLKVSGSKQVDRDGADAIDTNGNISENARTFWTQQSAADGNEVEEGGVAEWFRSKTNLDNRKVYSNFGASGALVAFTQTAAETSFGGAAALAAEMDVLEEELASYFSWLAGIDVDDDDNDDSTTDIRQDVFGDPLHSKPLVVNYGGSSDVQDIRIVVGTNAGVLHMFKDEGDTVSESWAFMPKEFLKNVKRLRQNYTSDSKVYGLDGSATLYTFDRNGDGSIVAADGDKAWVFVGSRRGGSSYYALDISDKNAAPKLMWHIDNSSAGFTEMGQSWSKPVVGYTALNIVNGAAKPTLFFGGGYSVAKDTAGVGGNDTVGRAVYMVDAATGKLLWSLSPASGSAANTYFPGTDSIPSAVGILDSDADGLVDRIYIGDTGGNIWRVDMPGNVPNSSSEPWTVFKLADLGAEDGSSDNSKDLRFFSEPSIVRTVISDTIETTTVDEEGVTTKVVTRQNRPYDAILIGSGDRSTPLDTDTQDRFFMVRDHNIATQSFTGDADAPYPNTVTIADLYDYTDNPFGQNLTTQQRETLELAVSAKSGWYIDLVGSGEKSTAAAIAIEGVAYFTSFQPAIGVSDVCVVDPVFGYLYGVDLALGTTVYNWNEQKILSTTGAIETPQLIITQDDNGGTPPCTGDDCPHEDKVNPTVKILAGKVIVPLGITIDTWRTYLYVTEGQ